MRWIPERDALAPRLLRPAGMRRFRHPRSWVTRVALVLLVGCQGAILDPHDEAPGGPGEGPDGRGVAATFAPDAPSIRLLGAREYRNTVRDLLGVEASVSLQYGDTSTGFDNSGGTQLDESLFSVLLVEAERIAREYVGARMSDDYPCFDPAAALGEACVADVVDDLGRRAYRRPLDEDTRSGLLSYAATISAQTSDSTQAAELLVTRILMSPRFLYRTEVGEPSPDGTTRLDAFERASLVSYTLTASMPDDELLADAEAGVLDDDRVRHHVRRLLATDAGRAQIVELFQQWLRATELDHMAEEPQDYPKLGGAELGHSLQAELGAFVDAVVLAGDGTFADLLTHDVAYVDRRTAALYGLESESDVLEPVPLPAGRPGGVLTLAGVLAVHSSSADIGRDNPIHRGLLVKNQLLCEAVDLPSGLDLQEAVSMLGEIPDFDSLTTREQLEAVMQQGETCQECHATFMPYGFLWSRFDALGQQQDDYNGRPLDSSVDEVYLDGRASAHEGAETFIPELARSPQAEACFRLQVARFATGSVEPAIAELLRGPDAAAFGGSDLRVVQLIEDLLVSPELYVREAR